MHDDDGSNKAQWPADEIFNNPLFKDEPYGKTSAYLWLRYHAKPTERGPEIELDDAAFAKAWLWTEPQVGAFINELGRAGLLTVQTDQGPPVRVVGVLPR